MSSIIKDYPLTNDEYVIIEKAFGGLIRHAANQLGKKNSGIFHNSDVIEDFNQEIKIVCLHAAACVKRQAYLKECFEVTKKYNNNNVVIEEILDVIKPVIFKSYDEKVEKILLEIMNKTVDIQFHPSKNGLLKITKDLYPYFKAVIWNRQKSLGKQLTKDKKFRLGLVSLSEYDYLAKNQKQKSYEE